MPTRRSRFTQADIIRAVKGFQDAGMTVGSVAIEPDGTIVVLAAGHQYEELRGLKDGGARVLPEPSEKPITPPVFSVRTLADRWQCSTGKIRNMIDRGELRAFRHGNLIRITPDAVADVEANLQR